MTKKWSDANTRKGRRYATPNCRGFIYAPWDLSLLRSEGSLSLLFSALFNDRPASLFLINTPSQPPNPTAKITTSFIDKNMSLNIYWSVSLSYITQADKDSISSTVSVKNNYSICSRANYGSLFPVFLLHVAVVNNHLPAVYIKKVCLEQVPKAQCWSKGIAPLFQTRRQMGNCV